MKLSLFLVITLLIGILSVEYALAQNFDNSEQGTKQYKNDTWSYYSETYDKFIATQQQYYNLELYNEIAIDIATQKVFEMQEFDKKLYGISEIIDDGDALFWNGQFYDANVKFHEAYRALIMLDNEITNSFETPLKTIERLELEYGDQIIEQSRQETLVEEQYQKSMCGDGTFYKDGGCVPACKEGTIYKDGKCVIENQGGGCLIATAAFGSEMAPQVQFLRELRDNTVLQTTSGTTFMTGFNQFYYSFSPQIADYERENPVFKEMVKVSLTPLLTSLTLLNYVDIDSEEEMLGYGIGIILLNVGMYFVAPAVLIISLKKRLDSFRGHKQ